MAEKSLHDLFVEELRDMYDGEKRLLKALPKMAKASGSRELQTAFTTHNRETEKQVTRLEQVFRTLGQKPRGKKCDGIMGIIEESSHAMEELEGPVLDAALIAGAQKAEHYEIASYGTLAYFAEMLGNDKAKNLLGQTLDEEKATDEKLTAIAKSDVNREALQAGDGWREVWGEAAALGSSAFAIGAARGIAPLGVANERTPRRRSPAGGASKRTLSRSKHARR